MKTLYTSLVIGLVVVSGCARASRVQVPANTVNFKTEHGSLSLQHPQDTQMKDVTIEIATNGTVRAQIGSLTTKNSADVIDQTAAGQVAIIKQWGDTGAQMFKAGAEAAGNAAGAAAKKSVGP